MIRPGRRLILVADKGQVIVTSYMVSKVKNLVKKHNEKEEKHILSVEMWQSEYSKAGTCKAVPDRGDKDV